MTVTGCEGDLFEGRVLNQPTHLRTVLEGQQIHFLMPAGSEVPVLVTGKYLRERSSWIIHPCDQCGFSELFDAPSDLIKVVFPNLPEGAVMEMLTSRCPLCGGIQGLEFRASSDKTASTPPHGKRWWQFWK